MRILLLGPTGGGGSLPPYLDVLAQGLRLHGVKVDRLGTPGVPYDSQTNEFWSCERITQAAEELLTDVDLGAYDLLSVHYGNLEIEQVLPVVWAQRRHRPPAVYHAHSLDWTLFTEHIPDPAMRSAVEDSIDAMDGFVFFGEYGHVQLAKRYNITVPTVVSWLPTTIPPGTRAHAGQALREALTCDHSPIGSLYAFASPWKDPANLIAACDKTVNPCRVILAGPSWNDPQQAGVNLTREATTGVRHGAAHVEVVSAYLGPADRKALALGSHFAVFPYREQPTFQGSGAIADYLAHGTPVIATDVANMAELVGDAGEIIEAGNGEALAESLDRFAADDEYRNRLSHNAKRRSRRFSASFHAAQCLRLYEQAIASHANIP